MVETPNEDDGAEALSAPDVAGLRFLRALVTTLTAVMIAGIVTIVVLLVIRLPGPPAPLPEALRLPGGTTALAFTRGPDWFAVVTGDDRILIYGEDGALRQEVRLDRGP